MAINIWRKLNEMNNSVVPLLAVYAPRMSNFTFKKSLIIGLHTVSISSKSGHRRGRSDLSIVAFFTLFMGASSAATAYGLSLPHAPISDSVTVRLQTNSIAPGDTEIANWWVEAGSTGFGSGRNDYFSSGSIEAPVMTYAAGYAVELGPLFGISNALVTNLPVNGGQIFLSIWLEREGQPWERVLTPVITASSSISPTTIVEGIDHNPQVNYFGAYLWNIVNGASWYQVWINNENGTNLHNKWYAHNEVCRNVHVSHPDQCALLPDRSGEFPPCGKFWVRAWSVNGGYGPWSQPANVNVELKLLEMEVCPP